MKEVRLYAVFFAVISASFLFLWWNSSKSSVQVGGALQGIPGTDPVSPFMAVLLIIWFILVGLVVYVNRPR